MRFALLLTLALIGCVAPPPVVVNEAPSEALPTRDLMVHVPNPAFNATAAYAMDFCSSNCVFMDEQFHLGVSYAPHDTSLDIVIAPVASAIPFDDIEAARAAVLDWQRALDEFAPAWLADGVTLNVYAVGIDVPSIDAVVDSDIIVLLAYGDRTGALGSFAYGQGIRPLELACGPPHHIAEPALDIYTDDCLGWGYECLAVSTIQSGTPDHVWNMVVHEVGHCLGNGHTGNAADFNARLVPFMDAMSYGAAPDRVSCVSNMNIELMARHFGPLLGQDAAVVTRGSHMPFPTADYRQGSCSPAETAA